MMECWAKEANLRPSFAELVKQLSGSLGIMAGYLDFSAPETVTDTKL
jgi:hypothetical protein